MGAAPRQGDVSVVIPVYNGAAFLAETLRSALLQTHPPCEILVVDDASTDASAAVAEKAASGAPVPVRLIRLPRNSGGPAHPINVGVGAAQAPLIAVLDQDDIVMPAWLEALASTLSSHPEAAFACCNCGRVGAPRESAALGLAARALRRVMAKARLGRSFVSLESREAIRLFLAFGNYVVGFPGFLFRRSDWADKGGLDETLRVSSDFDFLCWLALRGSVLFIPRRLYLHRFHAENLSLSGVRPWVELVRLASRYLPPANPPRQDRAFWRHFRGHYLRMLVGLGWANRHGDALGLLARSTFAGGVNAEGFSVLPRLLYTWLARNVRQPRTQPGPAEGAVLRAELEHLFDLWARRDAPGNATPAGPPQLR